MAYQAIPAFLALILKVALLGYAVRAPRRHPTTRLFILLLGVFALHNTIELFGMNHFAAHGFDEVMEIYGYLYFAIAIIFIALILHLSLRLSIDDWEVVRPYVPLIYAPAAIIEALLLGTHKLVAGFQLFQGITILRVPGPLYFLFESYATTYLIASLGYLVYGARPARTPVADRLRNRWWLAALTPFVVLNAYLIIANHYGLAKLPSTMTLPITLMLFLAIAPYATYQNRLFEITFFIPGSPARRRATAFCQRMQATLGELLGLHSVQDVLEKLADALGCSLAVVGAGKPRWISPANILTTDSRDIANFPRMVLSRIDRITVASEVAMTQPKIHSLMRQHGISAILPFRMHKHAAPQWLLMTDRFVQNVYTPLDFEAVETLLTKIGERFMDDMNRLRAQFCEARQDIHDYQRRLAESWAAKTEMQQRIGDLQRENELLRTRLQLLLAEYERGQPPLEPEKDLETYLADSERQVIERALAACGGNRAKAARMLGIRPNTLHYKMRRLGIETGHTPPE